MRSSGVVGLEAVVCMLMAIVGLVPVVELSPSSWGVGGSQVENGYVRVIQLETGSPAYRGGLRRNDQITIVEGKKADIGVIDQIRNLPAERALTLFVLRDGQSHEVRIVGVTPRPSGLSYRNPVAPAAGGVAFILALLVFITEPKQPPPRWRPLLLLIFGLILAAAFAVASAAALPSIPLARFSDLPTGGALLPGQGWLGVAAAVLLVFLAANELRLANQGKGEPVDE
jgi:hypothetical protein